jgi:hypothetical protein
VRARYTLRQVPFPCHRLHRRTTHARARLQGRRGRRLIRGEQVRGHIENGKVKHYQVTMKLGFRLED